MARSKRFTHHPLLDLFIPAPTWLLWEAFSHAAITAWRLFINISTTVYIQVLIYTADQTEVLWRKRKLKLWSSSKGIRTRALSMASPTFYRWATLQFNWNPRKSILAINMYLLCCVTNYVCCCDTTNVRWVCRYMILLSGKEQVYAIDRDNSIFHVPNLIFPRRKDLDSEIANTLIDGVSIAPGYSVCKWVPGYKNNNNGNKFYSA